MCVSVGGWGEGNEAFCSSSWEMVVLPGVCEFSDLNVEGEMGYTLLVRLYVLRIWQEQYSPGTLVTRAHGTQRAV